MGWGSQRNLSMKPYIQVFCIYMLTKPVASISKNVVVVIRDKIYDGHTILMVCLLHDNIAKFEQVSNNSKET